MSDANDTKILVIDDDETIAMQVEQILSKSGYSAVSAVNGREGLEKAEVENPNLIILDRRMPEMDGNATLIELKANVKTKDIPVVMLTGDNRVSDVSTSFDLGALDYIVKPFDHVNFINRIEQVLSKIEG